MDAHAQWEIQEYGRVMAGMLKRVAPLSATRRGSTTTSAARTSRAPSWRRSARWSASTATRLQGKSARLDRAALEGHGLAKREIDELLGKLAPPPAVPDFELDVASARSAEHFAERFAAAVPSGEKPTE